MKLLLIEDDLTIAALVRRGLTGEGFQVQVAQDGTEGLWLAREGAFDILIVDVMLPGTDGITICSQLRRDQDWTPILVLTARDSEHDHTQALAAGADDYLTKPFSFPILIARLRTLLRRSTTGGPAPVEVGDLRLDSAQRQVWRAETRVELTARQFEVLEFLMRRTGQVLSKSQILSGVWEYDFDGDPNIVEVYIRRLRAKIDEPFGRRSIQTVRGAGYRLVDDGA